MQIPRNEYPRPQLVRKDWLNLNGEWDFEIDNAKSGVERELFKAEKLENKITVPFCPESELSGINNKDFMECVWYRKNIEIPSNWNGKNIILHFGAVDYHAIVYVNGEKVCEHKGGYTPFSVDITEKLKDSGNYISLCAYDYLRSHNQPGGKQSGRLKSYSCYYTRTTGIWQTVWLEPVDRCYLKSFKLDTDINVPSVNFEFIIGGDFSGAEIKTEAFWEGKSVGYKKTVATSSAVNMSFDLSEKHLWAVGKGNLYDLKIEISKDGKILDYVESYFGLRSVTLDGKAFKINGETVFGRWVLDQGFYPDGIYTAPNDEALKNDILYSLELGFNGARLHEKVFEPRFLYWADKLGYICWGEHANWQLDISDGGSIQYFLDEWIEAVERDYNHPSIIGWCPFNETWDYLGRKQCDGVLRTVYRATKAMDKMRPVIDTSGNFHVETDIFDVHDYEQDPEKFASHYRVEEGILDDTVNRRPYMKHRQTYDGKAPTFLSEYGGIAWFPEGSEAWGYGNAPKSKEEFIERYKGLTTFLINNPYMLGFCYTQLYDVEQEQNGLMTYERKFKFDPEIFREINMQEAAIEKKKD